MDLIRKVSEKYLCKISFWAMIFEFIQRFSFLLYFTSYVLG